MTSFVCWRCVEREVEVPGMECGPCFEGRSRAQRKRAASTRRTGTSERTHERYRADMKQSSIDAESFRRWDEGR